MALIGFARVSTKEQDLSAQIEQLQAAGCDEICSGKQSGASDENE
jgi:DNA invertase Pin-like site-specific DNA recombinase